MKLSVEYTAMTQAKGIASAELYSQGIKQVGRFGKI